MSPSIFRPIRVVGLAFLALLVLGLVASALLTLREGRRLARAQEVFAQLTEFHRVHLVVTRRLILLGDDGDDAGRRDVHAHLDELQRLSIHPETPAKLALVHAAIDRIGADREVLYETVVAVHEIGVRERDTQAELLHQIQRDLLAQLQIEIAIPLVLLVGGLLLYPFARRRILRPLDAFGRQLSRLGEGDFTPAPADGSEPLLLPLHRRFNELAHRLRELEDHRAAYETELEQEIRTATGALLEQQRGLARAERLAATGELAASVAHELRNPLAGIQMTLQNLRAEVGDPEVAERLDRVGVEVERLARLLNQLLDGARHAPEAARELRLEELVSDLLALTRHQVPERIRLQSRIPPGLTVRLPPDRLRQALLNLILNAAAAIGEQPGCVTLAAALEADRLRLEVTDDGPGFPPDALESASRPFFSTREDGTGLGLALVRRFARDLGGEMVLANQTPRGARVTLLLPARV